MMFNVLHGKYSNYHYCIVQECKNSSIKTPDKLWISVPKDKNKRHAWLKAARRDPLNLSTDTRLYFCEDHFDLENDMENYMQYKIMGSVKKIRMKPDAVPSRFECLSDRKRKLTPTTNEIEPYQNECSELYLNPTNVSSLQNSGYLDFPQTLPKDMENFMKFKLMGSVGKIRMRPHCLPSKFVCQQDQRKRVSTRTSPLTKNKKTTLMCNLQTAEIEDLGVPSTSGRTLNAAVESFAQQKTFETKAVQSEKGVPGPADSSSAGTLLTEPHYLDSNVKLEDPLAIEPPHTNDTTPQCRFCAEFSKDCVEVTDKDRPYLTRNKTALTISDLSVELDFNDALPKTVCRACDSKLLEMFKFVKQVKEAQDSLINVRDYVIENDTVVVKNECESPTPDDSDDIDSNDDIVDSLIVTDTVFVKPNKPIIKPKRKRVESPKSHTKPKVTEDVESEEVDIIIDIKEETAELAEMVDTYETENVEFDDTEMDAEPSELELQTLLKLMK